MLTYFRLLLTWIAHSDRVGITAMRIAIAIVFLWIGRLSSLPTRPTASRRSSRTAR